MHINIQVHSKGAAAFTSWVELICVFVCGCVEEHAIYIMLGVYSLIPGTKCILLLKERQYCDQNIYFNLKSLSCFQSNRKKKTFFLRKDKTSKKNRF